MSTYRLDRLFSPKSVVLAGASPRPTSTGGAVLRNLRHGGFAGAIHLVNPHYDEIEGIRSVKSFDDLPAAPDLGIIAVPPPAVPSVVAAAGAKGTAAAIIITAGLGHGPGSLAEACELQRELRQDLHRSLARRDHHVHPMSAVMILGDHGPYGGRGASVVDLSLHLLARWGSWRTHFI